MKCRLRHSLVTVGGREDCTPWMGPQYIADHTIMYMLQETGFTQAGCKLLGVKGPNEESKDIRFKMTGLVFLLVKIQIFSQREN